MELIHAITSPADVKRLDAQDLDQLAAEIRDLLVTTVARTGGHLGSNLGIVELTIALHRVFSSPRDRILFDTGHQAYTHKLLTGRGHDFGRLRQPGGLSGYPSQAESPHDLVENSHASTVLSYADGMAKALALRGDRDSHVVAVIGDGALTGGMAWEGLNNIAHARAGRVIMVVNDNGRSYSPTVGGANRGMFEALGLPYVGPVDGHDVKAVEEAFRRARDLHRTVVVHCITKKGCGYPPAEADAADRLHSPGPFDAATGQLLAAPGPTWTGAFGEELVKIGAGRPDVVAITAAMLGPTGLDGYAASYPDRTFDVGIAEQHAITSAAGLAMGGMHPVVAIYATFLNRAFDQILMDVALHRLPVTLVLDRAGVTGNDGASHNGMWDMSLLQIVPGIRIAAPRDTRRLKELLNEAVAIADGPTVVRFPKGSAPADIEPIDSLAGLDVLARYAPRHGPSVLIVSAGAMASVGLEAARLVADQGMGATVVDPRWVHPLNPLLSELALQHDLVAVVEDNGRVNGVGDAMARRLADDGITGIPVHRFAIPQRFLAHGTRSQILQEAGLHPVNLAAEISRFAALAAAPGHRERAGLPAEYAVT
jgi:1-deoxy-D-xylulose-5-phosphate synthase